jgi:branched-chain amino acid transport system ATP-binding protein
MLEVSNLTKSFGGITAVDHCSFSVEQNTITGLIGPNGAGKTTVFNLLTGFYKVDGGSILFNGENITNQPPNKISQRGLVRTFQIIRLFSRMTALENLLVSMSSDDEGLFDGFLRLKKIQKKEEEHRKRANKLLDFINLSHRADVPAEKLSYGQQKLLEIARALSLKPKMLLLDEPMAGVNPTMRQKLMQLIRKLKDDGMTIMIIEHDMNTIMNLCDTIIVLDYGKEIAVGTPEEIQNNQRVIEAYLGVKR